MLRRETKYIKLSGLVHKMDTDDYAHADDAHSVNSEHDDNQAYGDDQNAKSYSLATEPTERSSKVNITYYTRLIRDKLYTSKKWRMITLFMAITLGYLFIFYLNSFSSDMGADLEWNLEHSGRYYLPPIEEVDPQVLSWMFEQKRREEMEILDQQQLAKRNGDIRELALKIRHEMRDKMKSSYPEAALLDEQDELAEAEMLPKHTTNLGGGSVFSLMHLAYLAPRANGEHNIGTALFQSAMNTTHSLNPLAYGFNGVSWFEYAIANLESERVALLGRKENSNFRDEDYVGTYERLTSEEKNVIHKRAQKLLSLEDIRSPPMLGMAKTVSSAELMARMQMAQAPTVVLFTTLFTPKKLETANRIRSNEAQYALIKSAADLRPQVDIVAFTDDPAWHEYCARHDVLSINLSRTNKFGLPFLRDMYIKIERDVLRPESKLFGYVNSDILLDKSSLVATVNRILADAGVSNDENNPASTCSWEVSKNVLKEGKISVPSATCELDDNSPSLIKQSWGDNEIERVKLSTPSLQPRLLITGRRVSVPPYTRANKPSLKLRRRKSYKEWMRDQLDRGVLERGYSIDYFLVTKGAINWIYEMPDCVIARAGFDNWFVRWAKLNSFPNSIVRWPDDARSDLGLRWMMQYAAESRDRLTTEGKQDMKVGKLAAELPKSFPLSLLPPAWIVGPDNALSLVDASKSVVALHIYHPEGGHDRLTMDEIFSRETDVSLRHDLGWNILLTMYMYRGYNMPSPFFTGLSNRYKREIVNVQNRKVKSFKCAVAQTITTDLNDALMLQSSSDVNLIKCFGSECVCRAERGQFLYNTYEIMADGCTFNRCFI